MRKILVFCSLFVLLLSGCKKDIVEKPDNLIEEEVLISIICDLAILEASKIQYTGVQYEYPKATEFVKKKYKIDSITFAKSTQYYAADVENYKKIYIKAKEKIENDAKTMSGGKQLQTMPDLGVVK
jgi:hypothetical protein